MNFSKRSVAVPSRFPPPRRAAPCSSRDGNGDGSSGGGQTPACRGKPCCIKPTNDSCFHIAACNDMPLPVAVDGTVAVEGSVGINGPVEVQFALGSEPLEVSGCIGVEMCGSEPLEVSGCIGVEMCGSEPLCVQMENKPDTTLCTTSFNYAPICSIFESVGCGYNSFQFNIDCLPLYYATNRPVLCAPDNKILRTKCLQQRQNQKSLIGSGTESVGVTGWKIASTGQTFLLSGSRDELKFNYGDLGNFQTLPADAVCEGTSEGNRTFVFKSSSHVVDLNSNDVLIGTMEVANPNDPNNTNVYETYVENLGEDIDFNLQVADFKATACCEQRPDCIEPLVDVQDTYVTDLQVFELAKDSDETFVQVEVPFCIVDCENEPIAAERSLLVEFEGSDTGTTFVAFAVKIDQPNKYKAQLRLNRNDFATVTQVRVSDALSDIVLFASTQTFNLALSA